MISSISWSKEDEVGLPEADSQHKALFKIVDRMNISSSLSARECAMELYRHTRQHFKTEEDYLIRIGYPQLVKHQKLHAELISQLNNRMNDGLETEEAINAFKQFYKRWHTQHIETEDSKFIEFSRQLH